MIRSLCSWSNTAKTKLTSLLVSVTVARNSNLIRSVDCYGYTCNYNPIIVTNKNKYFN